MNEDIIKKLNYIIENTNCETTISYCEDMIKKFQADQTKFIEEYQQSLSMQNLANLFGEKGNQIKLPALTPQESNIPNEMNNLKKNINILYSGIKDEAIRMTKEYIISLIDKGLSEEKISKSLRDNKNKIIKNNYAECINSYMTEEDFKDSKKKSLYTSLKYQCK